MLSKKQLASVAALCVLLLLSLITGAVATSMWTITFDEKYTSSTGNSLIKTPDGGYALCGGRNGEFCLVKINADGAVQWNQTYGGHAADTPYSLVATSDGGYALAGATDNFGAIYGDLWLVKTDAQGNKEWDQRFGGSNYEKAYCLVQTSDGGYAIAGETNDIYKVDGNFLLVKTDANGNFEWNQTFGGDLRESAHSLVETSDGGFAMVGYTWSFSTEGGRDFWLVKTDSFGNHQWNKTYGGPAEDIANEIIETPDGGFAIAGVTGSFGGGGCDFWLVKTDKYGNMQWNKTYGRSGYDTANSLTLTSDGGYAIAGNTVAETLHKSSNQDGMLVKTDAYGNMEWYQTYGNLESNYFRAVVESDQGGYLIAGIEGNDLWLVKTDEIGDIPEFSSWLVLPLIVTLALIVRVYRKKLHNNQPKLKQ